MKAIVKVLVPVTLAFGAIGVAGAQTIETDYPGPFAHSAASAPSQVEPTLIQVSEGAVQVNPDYEQSTASREEVRSKASLSVPAAPGYNA